MRQLILLAIIILYSNYSAQAQKTVGPHLLVYKTKGDYRRLVPVVLAEDRSKIVSYPDPADIKNEGTKMLPIALHGGYFINYNGISPNAAFLKITFARYAALNQTPPPDQLFKMVLDTNPLTSLYDCGVKSVYKNPEAQINELIDRKMLSKKCKSLLK